MAKKGGAGNYRTNKKKFMHVAGSTAKGSGLRTGSQKHSRGKKYGKRS